MFQNGQIHFKILGAFPGRFFKRNLPFWDITHYSVGVLRDPRLLDSLLNGPVDESFSLANLKFFNLL